MNPSLNMNFEPLIDDGTGAIVGWEISQTGRETVRAGTQVEAYWLARKAPRR